jgi:hypothetical protein
VAIEHSEAETISRHRFARSGDLFKATATRMRKRTAASAVLRILNIELVHQSGAQRLPLPCPKCAAEELTESGAFPCTLSRGVNDFTAVNAGESDRFLCQVCDRATYPDELLADLPKRELDELVKSGLLRPFAPERKVYVVAELDSKRSVASTAVEALRLLVGQTFELTQKLSRIEATSLEHAQDLVEKYHASMPWKQVQIGRDLEPTDVHWHGGRLSDVEKRRVEGQAIAARVRGLESLDDELETIRRERTAQLRTV